MKPSLFDLILGSAALDVQGVPVLACYLSQLASCDHPKTDARTLNELFSIQ